MQNRLLIWIYCIGILLFPGCRKEICPDRTENRSAVLFPDYQGVTFPANIAPPTCKILEEGEQFFVRLRIDDTIVYSAKNSSGHIRIPLSKWKKALAGSQDGVMTLDIFVHKEKEWVQYLPVENRISSYSIDPYLVYRLIRPGYELWNKMGIYQRDLSSFTEQPLLENKDFGYGCMNCHTFCNHSPPGR